MPTLTPNILFNHEALEAAEFYVSVFADAEIRHVNRFGDAGPLEVGTVLTVDFVLDGQEFTAINSGVTFVPNESISFRVSCHGQEEVDHYWYALSEGGSEGQCGWLKDRFGVSWQITPAGMGAILGGPDPAGRGRAMRAMMSMGRLEIAALEAAYRGEAE